MKSFARHLKPGGTLAIALYGRTLMLDNLAAEKPWNEIFEVWYERALQHGSGSVVERAFRHSETGLDTVPFDEKLWEKGVKEDHA
jgi:hypothetical protein